MIRFPIAMMLATLCIACAPVPAVDTAAVPEAPRAVGSAVVLSGARAFAVAELTYISASKGVALLVDAGVVHGEAASRVRALNARARQVLVTGKAALTTADQAAAAAELFGIADRLDTFNKGVT